MVFFFKAESYPEWICNNQSMLWIWPIVILSITEKSVNIFVGEQFEGIFMCECQICFVYIHIFISTKMYMYSHIFII